jgi:hypothetical protein
MRTYVLVAGEGETRRRSSPALLFEGTPSEGDVSTILLEESGSFAPFRA